MSLARRLAHRIAGPIHRLLARSRWLSRCYLEAVGSLLHLLPDGQAKAQCCNLLRATAWPEVALKPRRVELAKGLRLMLMPHVGEFDFDALIFRQLRYEPEVFSFLAANFKRWRCVVEVGSNVGIFTLYLAAEANQRQHPLQIYGFEPSLKAFGRLRANLECNPGLEVNAFALALAPQAGFPTFHEPQGHLTNGSLLPDFASAFSSQIQRRRVPAMQACAIAELLDGSGANLIKIDAEGVTSMILDSMRELILQRRPELIIEVLTIEEPQLNALDWLLEAYDLHRLSASGPLAQPRFNAHESERDFWLQPRPASAANVPKAAPLTQP